MNQSPNIFSGVTKSGKKCYTAILIRSLKVALGHILWEIKIKIDPLKIELVFQRTDFHTPLQQLYFMGD